MTEQPGPEATDAGVDSSGDAGDNELYHGYSVDDETQPQGEGDSLVDERGLADPLEEGYSPPEKWSAGQGYGNTPLEEEMGETIDQRLAQEVPEPDPYAAAEAEARDPEHPVGEVAEDFADPEVGDERAGRLVAPDEGVRTDTDSEADAEDVGIDGAGSSAEEAAVHVVDEDNP